MSTADIRMKIYVRTGWARFILHVAMRLFDWHLGLLAMLWLWATQKTFIIGMAVDGHYQRFLWFRWRKWSYRRTSMSVLLTLSRKHRAAS